MFNSYFENKMFKRNFNWLIVNNYRDNFYNLYEDEDEDDYEYINGYELQHYIPYNDHDMMMKRKINTLENKVFDLIKKFIEKKFEYVDNYKYDEGDEDYMFGLNYNICYYRKIYLLEELIDFFEKNMEQFDFKDFKLEHYNTNYPYITGELDIIIKQVDELIVLLKKEIRN